MHQDSFFEKYLVRTSVLLFLAALAVVIFSPWAFAAPGSAPQPNLISSSEEAKAATEYSKQIDEEYGYRKRVEAEAASWVRELMFMYKWSALHPEPRPGEAYSPPSGELVSLRLQSEFAWITVTSHGLLATFDFAHADQTLLGSTSRFVSTLLKSAAFWTEVRSQCLAIHEMKVAKGIKTDAEPVRDCAERFRRDLNISQIAGSNASLFIGGGLVIGLGKRVFQRLAGKWFATRVLPALPAFARTKWAAAGLMAAVIVVPAGFVVASVSEERETNKIFYENLASSITASIEESERTTLVRAEALEIEREVLELAGWINERAPRFGNQMGTRDEAAAREFMSSLQMFAPHYAKLKEKRERLDVIRQSLEAELRAIPGVTARLVALAEERKHGNLKPEDATLFRRAQYLASLRLVLKTMPDGIRVQ